MKSYRRIFPNISPDRFYFSGAVQWIRDNLTEWLYDSHGRPVAFKALDHVFTRWGRFIGTIRGHYHPRQDIWYGAYKGEIVEGNRLLFIDPPPSEDRGGGSPPPPPGVPRLPEPIDHITGPPGYRDVEIPNE
jgi:hypothetical protein